MAAIPVIKGKMGSTIYYVGTMTARELVSSTRPARDLDSWASASIEERMQREPDISRVKRQIVPYLAEHKDRFFGAIIVVVPEGSLEYEDLGSHIKGLKLAYREGAEQMGFLVLGKGERIILDGQHRWYAAREVIQSNEDLGEEQRFVGDDNVTVIFIEDTDPRKTRRIFNKVNRYAKPTSRADNILTSEDNGYAIISRWLLDKDEDSPLAEREYRDDEGVTSRWEVVQWRSSTLSRTMRHLTTIGTVYDNTKTILDFAGHKDLDRTVSPSDQVLETCYEEVATWFHLFMMHLDAYRDAAADPEAIKTNRFTASHPHTLLLRPVGQTALIRGITQAMDLSRHPVSNEPRLTLERAIERVNKVDFTATAESIWRETIVRADGRMVARNEAYNLAARLLAYLIAAEYHTEDLKTAVWASWNSARGKATITKDIKALKAEGKTEQLPEELPEPVQ
ncbi:DGQHR domain-containing protein [Nonomuraea sp. ATR24]|uniref:DGQHR domain-containing protein n=1 Tax=Nonomuraea sp. ATR24 TaxID=1676744 RepID=UPI0035C0B02F